MSETDYTEEIKQKVAEQLANFLIKKDKKPERVELIIDYRESRAKIQIDLND